VIVVLLVTLTPVARCSAELTVAPVWKPVPVIVTGVPPLAGPEPALSNSLSAPDSVAVPLKAYRSGCRIGHHHIHAPRMGAVVAVIVVLLVTLTPVAAVSAELTVAPV